MIKTIVNAVTGKEIFCIKEGSTVSLKEDEIIIPEVRKDVMADPYFNFETREFYDNGTPGPKVFSPIKPMYMRLALDHFSMLDAIELALSAPENKEKKIAFEYALSFERDDEMINGFAQAFGLSSSQVDGIFEYAESIQK